MDEKMTYKSAGVDVTAGYDAVSRMQRHIARTAIPGVVGGIGGFGGMFEIPSGYKNPVLVSGTDSVGTKIMLAFMSGIHNTVGIDCVAMCANDIVCQGAKPLFFLDYIGSGKLLPDRIEEIVAGVAEGCVRAGCAIVGGETAELPGLYNDGEYDLAGFCVGIVEKDEILSRANVKSGDILIGLPSSGIHSNGFSLVRKLFFEKLGVELRHYYDELGKTLGEELMIPTRIYVKPLLELLDTCEVRAVAHITGGGFIENIPRIIGDGLAVRIELKTIPTPPIFNLIAKLGNIEQSEMYNTFNMGIGLTLAVPADGADRVIETLRDIGESPVIIGDVVEKSDAEILFV